MNSLKKESWLHGRGRTQLPSRKMFYIEPSEYSEKTNATNE